MEPQNLVQAAKVPRHLVPWQGGPYNAFVERETRAGARERDIVSLCAHNMAGLHMIRDDGFGGDVIMDDSDFEIRKHLPGLLRAKGRILKTGLGLGCFVRAALSKPDVDHIDVIEIDHRIAEHFGAEFAGNPRVTIHIADALRWQPEKGARYELAWHDIWCEGNDGLAELHTKLIVRFARYADRQGAWAYPRLAKRIIRKRRKFLELVG